MSLKVYLRRVVRAIMGRPDPYITADIKLSSSNNRLAGKRIIITGGSRGIGASMAKRFVQEGAKVLITGRNEDSLKQYCSNVGCQYLVLDLLETNKIKEFIDKTKDILGGIDILVNNAGISLHEASFLNVTPENFDVQFFTNLRGPFFLTQSVIDYWIKESMGGYILFISSETGDTVDFRPYGLSKVAINSLTKGLANLYAPNGIIVNALSPGVTASDMTGFKSDENLYYSDNTLKRVYLPEEISEIATYLISGASSCISGQIITCNNAKTVNPRWKKI